MVFNKVPYQRLSKTLCSCNARAAFAWISNLLKIRRKLKYVVSSMGKEETVKFEGSVPLYPKAIRTKFTNEAVQSLMIQSSSDGENAGCGPPGCRLLWTLEVCLS